MNDEYKTKWKPLDLILFLFHHSSLEFDAVLADAR